MTLQQFIMWLSDQQFYLFIYFGALPVLAFLASLIYKSNDGLTFDDYTLSVIIYLVAIPGMFSASLLLYHILMIRSNILNLNLTVYFLPVASMVLTFYLISRKAKFKKLPGFDRLLGLVTMLGIIFLILFFLSRLFFIIGFFGSIGMLAVIGVGLFVVFKVAMSKFFK
ncbi:MAG: hypothetical protein MI922_28570, partial [Bacteroidales bacterium]|nr:hypothetical protein [Bacteroidales bacterium]